MSGFVNRVKLVRPRVAVPSAGPCTVLDPDLLWLNSEERGIFIDPAAAVAALEARQVAAQGLYMAATDVWDSRTGFDQRTPADLRANRAEYIARASARMAPCSARETRARRLGPCVGSDSAPPAGVLGTPLTPFVTQQDRGAATCHQ